MAYILLTIGLALLVKGADYLIDGSTSLAKRFKVPSLIIGLTVVALGTSLPEFVINIVSALQGTTQVAFGNVIGSNIANTLLVLGVAAMIRPLKIAHSTVWREIPFSLLAALILLTISNIPSASGPRPSSLTRIDGVILLFFLAIFIYYLYDTASKNRSNLVDEQADIELLSSRKTALYIIVGIIGLYVGGNLTVSGAVSIARGVGASEFLISATVIALGTSLPELITSVRAALRKDSDLAVGNVIGSNVLNIFLVLGTTAVITPVELPRGINIDFTFLISSSLILFIFMFIGQRHMLKKWQGTLFLLGYTGYILLSVTRGL